MPGITPAAVIPFNAQEGFFGGNVAAGRRLIVEIASNVKSGSILWLDNKLDVQIVIPGKALPRVRPHVQTV